MRTRILAMTLGAMLLCTAPLWAQERATLTLKSGERVSGELVDMGAAGFSVNVNGKARQIATGDVAVITFASAGRTRAPAGRGGHVLVLRNGEALRGELVDVGGTHPLKIRFKVNNATREFASNEVARIVLSESRRRERRRARHSQ